MAAKRKRSKGTAAAPKAVHHKKRRHSSGGKSRSRSRSGGGKKKTMTGFVSQALVAVAGGLAAGVVANKLPIKNDKMKAAFPVAAGAATAFMGMKKHNEIIAHLGLGMLVLGVVALVRKTVPAIPLLAGEDENAMLEYMGDPVGLSSDEEEVFGDPVGLSDDGDGIEILGDGDEFEGDDLDDIHLTPAAI